MRLAPPPRVVDAAILLAVGLAVATGLVSFVSGRVSDAWIFVLHGVVGFALVLLLALKLRRVLPRLRDPDGWDRRIAASVVTLLVATAALATGLAWSLGGEFGILLWTGLSVHVLFGLLVVPVLLYHLTYRFHLPERVDFAERRTALQLGVLAIGGAIAWRGNQLLAAVLGATDRFTGSRHAGQEPGNTFPVTAWVADDPEPIDRESWTLRVGGAVSTPRAYTYADLAPADRRRATLDCTSGWYTEQAWAGVRVGRLLDDVEPSNNARWVRFESVTGYRWNLPIEEARGALLATRVGGERLSHGHGAPLRLVAPGRRGFQWVKWVERIEVRESPDYGQWAAIFTSGFG